MIKHDIFGDLPKEIQGDIKIVAVRHHRKASEAYVDIEFKSETNELLKISVPVNYRRTGIDASSAEECVEIIRSASESFYRKNLESWKADAQKFWESCDKNVTHLFFDAMNKHLGKWVCQGCQLPQNPNWARRTQEIKEQGYTVATAPKKACKKCGKSMTHLMLLPIQRGAKTGYETWSAKLRSRILSVLGSYDAYEGCVRPSNGLLPDHKFPEIRWDDATKMKNSDTMTDEQIRTKFQLLNNQRNQQKREVCRQCCQTGQRGYPFGIKYFYQGSMTWPENTAKRGIAAEDGCKGCAWYDFEAWRTSIVSKLEKEEGRL